MTTDELPYWHDVSSKKKKNMSLSALELFIYNHEPCGEDEDLFRDNLVDMINEILEEK